MKSPELSSSSSVGNYVRNSRYTNSTEDIPKSSSYLCLKSSVLSPLSTRLTNQYLALEQLCAHYQMISRAKAQVDTSLPKSMQSSLRRFGQRKKEYWQPFTSSKSNLGRSKATSSSILKNQHSERNQNCASREITSEGSSLTSERRTYDSILTVGDKVSWFLNTVKKPRTKYTHINNQNENDIFRSEEVLNFNQNIKNNISIADKLSWYLDAVQQGAFKHEWPRNSSYESSDFCSLQSNESYNHNSLHFKQGKKKICNSTKQSKIAVNKRKPSESLSSNTRHHRSVSYKKKPISKIQNTKNSADSYSDESSNSDFENTPRSYIQIQKNREIQQAKRLHLTAKEKNKATKNSLCSFPSRNKSILDILERNDEKYTNFVSAVTEDILKRGIYTDGAIKKALMFHMKQQTELKQDVVSQLIDQFMRELSISKEDSFDSYHPEQQTCSIRSNTPPERDNFTFDFHNDNLHEEIPDNDQQFVLPSSFAHSDVNSSERTDMETVIPSGSKCES